MFTFLLFFGCFAFCVLAIMIIEVVYYNVNMRKLAKTYTIEEIEETLKYFQEAHKNGDYDDLDEIEYKLDFWTEVRKFKLNEKKD